MSLSVSQKLGADSQRERKTVTSQYGKIVAFYRTPSRNGGLAKGNGQSQDETKHADWKTLRDVKLQYKDDDMNIKPIKNDDDLASAVIRMRSLRGAEPNTPAGDEMEILAVLVEAYEKKRHDIAPPAPIRV